MTTDVVTICSGGLDSVTAAHWARNEYGGRQMLVSFDYGQRHVRELQYAAMAADRLEAEHRIVDLTNLAGMLHGSALTDATVAVPDGHYAAETMKATVVPNRNAIMLSIATGIAVAEGAWRVVIGVHGGDHFIYPDCRPGFIKTFAAAMWLANDGFTARGFDIVAPFLHWTKSRIASEARVLGIPIGDTWSCYKGGDVHCGACSTCFERREAIRDAGITDPTPYMATPEYAAP